MQNAQNAQKMSNWVVLRQKSQTNTKKFLGGQKPQKHVIPSGVLPSVSWCCFLKECKAEKNGKTKYRI